MKWFHWVIGAIPALAAGLMGAHLIPASAVAAVGVASTVAGIVAHSPLATPPK